MPSFAFTISDGDADHRRELVELDDLAAAKNGRARAMPG